MAYTALFTALAAMIGVLLYWKVEIISLGGPVMIPIVMCSVFSLAIIFERSYSFFFQLHLGKDIEQFFERMRADVEKHQWKDVQTLCESWPGPVSRVALAGIAVHESTPQEIDEAMAQDAHEELPAVEKHLRWLSTLAQVATLLGLLGTVTGLVRAFQVIQQKSGAGGVWEALITTVAGLMIAIPTILAYNYFAGRLNEVQFQMEKAAGIISGWRRRHTPHA